MKYFIDRESKESAYMQLYRQLRRDIISGEIVRGSKLPSKRLVAGELGISLVTVEHAYALLLDEGYAESRERSGYFAAFGGETRQEKALPPIAAEQSLSDVPEDFPFSALAKTMRRVLTEYDRRILIKSPGSGCIELRSAIAAYLERSRGIDVSPEQIVIGSGAEYLYSMIVQLLGRETTIAHEEPCYERIVQVYEANGASCMPLTMGEDGILSSALAGCQAGALHVSPFNSYPSRVTASASKRHEYAAWAAEKGSLIVEDDYDSEFSSVTKHIDTIYSIAPENTIYLNTFTRTLVPSIRTAYMVLPKRLLGQYQQKLGFYSCTVPVFEQFVLAEYINSGELECYINRRRRKMRKS
ncbi:MAG: PLP-dependent aminotransferase family protein [Oscillospiraceae bacterium]|nr:PLP-dependent aminotransferase family protein [Oscillospiraceae bacterium]